MLERHFRSRRAARWAGVCVLAAVSAGAIAVGSGCGSGDQDAATARSGSSARPPLSASDRRIGGRVFHEICHTCHTLLGQKNPSMTNGEPQGPNLDEVVVGKKYVEERVRSGGIAMASWQQALSKRELAAIVNYVSSLSGRHLGPDEIDPAVLAAGEKVFVEHCNVCHSIADRPRTGKPELPGADFTLVKPSAAWVRWMVLRRYGFMEAFRDRLTPSELRNVAAFIQAKAG